MIIFKPGEPAPRILIADDDPSIVRLLADRCSLMGFEVETVSNGTQALRRIRQGGIDTLIIDVQMPELDGLSVSAYLLEYSKRPLHVIVVTDAAMRKPSEPATAWARFMFARMGAFGKIWMLRWPRSTPQTRITSICRDRARRMTPRRSRVSPIDDDVAVEGFLRSRLDKCGAGTLFPGRPPGKSPRHAAQLFIPRSGRALTG